MIKRISCLFLAFTPFWVATVAGSGEYPRAGAKAALVTYYHQVSGTATIVSSNTIHVHNFNYDGGGPAVYFYLGTNATHDAFAGGIYFTNVLSGTTYSNDTVVVTLPGDQTLDGYNALSVWCADFSIDFGSGTFQPYIDTIGRVENETTLRAVGAPGQLYELQASTNSMTWTGLGVMTNVTGSVILSDTNPAPTRFYRLQLQ